MINAFNQLEVLAFSLIIDDQSCPDRAISTGHCLSPMSRCHFVYYKFYESYLSQLVRQRMFIIGPMTVEVNGR